jgi:hypothetical protein
LNSALNRRAALHRIEREFDSNTIDTSLQDSSQFDWSEKIKTSEQKRPINKANFTAKNTTAIHMKIDQAVTEEDESSSSSDDTEP